MSRGLFNLPWLSWSESKLSELFKRLHRQPIHSPFLRVESSFQGSPDNFTGVATFFLVPGGPIFISSPKTHLKDLCQTLTIQSLFQEKDIHYHWRWASWVASSSHSSSLPSSQPCLSREDRKLKQGAPKHFQECFCVVLENEEHLCILIFQRLQMG